MNNLSESELRQSIVALAKQLLDDQLIVRTWGNISAKLDKFTMLITPSGKAYDTMKPSDLVKLSIVDLEKLDPNEPKPSSEAPMHAIAYRIHHGVNVVVHTHQIYASALSLSTREFPLKGDYATCFETRSLPISDYALPSTKKLHHHMELTLKSNPSKAVLMARHGAFVMAKDFKTCLNRTRKLETFAKTTYQKMTNHTLTHRTSIDFDSESEKSLRLNSTTNGFVAISHDPELKFLGSKTLKPYLDDFAQIVGTQVSKNRKSASAVLSTNGPYIYCYGNTKEDANNVRAVLEKNLRATIIGEMFGQKPINRIESRLMREIYQRKYSRLQ